MNGESFVCSICENTLQKTEFPKDRTRSFGIKKTCKNCLANVRHGRKKTLSEEELIALANKKRKYNQRYGQKCSPENVILHNLANCNN